MIIAVCHVAVASPLSDGKHCSACAGACVPRTVELEDVKTFIINPSQNTMHDDDTQLI